MTRAEYIMEKIALRSQTVVNAMKGLRNEALSESAGALKAFKENSPLLAQRKGEYATHRLGQLTNVAKMGVRSPHYKNINWDKAIKGVGKAIDRTLEDLKDATAVRATRN